MDNRANTYCKSILLLCILLMNAPLVSLYSATYTDYTFIHSEGQSQRSFVDGLQGVHEQTQVVYVPSGSSVRLIPLAANSRYAYRRWFVYSSGTEGKLSSLSPSSVGIGTKYNNATYYETDKGLVVVNSDENEGSSNYPVYTCQESDVRRTIVCEQSCYKDFVIKTNTKRITEPTLSQRIIFDIRPASEMAAEVENYKGTTAPGSYTGNYMEEYTLMAPTGSTLYIGPSYQFNGGNYPNYYYQGSSSINSLSNATWLWNGTAPNAADIVNNQYIKVESNRVGTQTYTLAARIRQGRRGQSSTYYYIAKFTVRFVDPSRYGPTESPTEASNLNDLDTLYEERFNANAPQTTTPTYCQTPLDWTESTYGFFYSALTPDKRLVHSGTLDPTWSDYALLNSTNGLHDYFIDNVYNHGSSGTIEDAKEGYFLYVDGAPEPGKLFTIKVDTNLCPGAVMYLSAYFAAIQKSGSNPQFDFTLSGVVNGQTKTILTYATGEIKTAGVWQRIVVPIEMEEDYESYSLVITNKGNNISGNDFIFDDFQILASKPPVRSLQASSQVCIDPMGDELTTYLRITLDNQNLNNVSHLYYQWTDDSDIAIDMDYYGKEEQGGESYGSIPVKGSIANYPVYSSLVSFDAYASDATKTPTVGYVEENGTQVLYVATRARLVPDKYYVGYVATDPSQLRNATCGLRTELQVEGSMYLTVDGERIRDDHRIDYCSNRLIRFGVERLFISNDATSIVRKRAICSADFLWGTPEYIDANYSLYHASFAEIRAAIESRRAGSASAAQTALLNSLTKAHYLTTDMQSMEVYLSADKLIRSLMYVAFPIPGTGLMLDDNGNVTTEAVDVCTDPVYGEVMIRSVELKAIRIGTELDYAGTDTLPDFVTSRPRLVRVSATQAKTGEVDIPIFCNFAGDKTFHFESAVLYATDDQSAMVGVLSLPLQNTTVEKTDTEITLTGVEQLKEGYTYSFRLREDDYDLSDCSLSTETVFSLAIVPDRVVWSPLSGSDAWNDDDNWKTEEGKTAFCPLAETDVILQAGDNVVPMSMLVSDETQKTGVRMEKDAAKYISFDINFVPFTCRNIYLPAGTTLLNQHFVSIGGKAVVDMEVPTNRWVICSMPLAEGVSGDFWAPSSGESSTDVFAVKTIEQVDGAYASDRLDNTVWQSLYNKSMVNYGDYDVPVISSEWTEPLNALNTAYPAGVGVALWVESSAGASTVSFRLPKSDSQYKWYYNNLWKSSPVVSIARGSGYGRPAFEYSAAEDGMSMVLSNYDAAGNLFLFGNPTWAYIDMEKLLDGNAELQASYYVLTEGTQELTATVKDISVDGGEYRYLAPMRGVLVQTSTAAQSVTLHLTPDMLCSSNKSVSSGLPARKEAPLLEKEVLYVAVSANDDSYGGVFTSRAAIVTDRGLSDDARQDEDATFLLLDEWKTPFGVFTMSEDKQPLSINAQSHQDTIPLCVYAQHSIGAMSIRFGGSGTEDWELYDSQTLTAIPLEDGQAMAFYAPKDGSVRYYLRRIARGEIETDVQDVSSSKVYAVGGIGEMRLYADNNIEHYIVYDALGREVSISSSSGHEVRCSLPAGIYVVRVLVNNEWTMLRTLIY